MHVKVEKMVIAIKFLFLQQVSPLCCINSPSLCMHNEQKKNKQINKQAKTKETHTKKASLKNI
jgi:hypothetical protein